MIFGVVGHWACVDPQTLESFAITLGSLSKLGSKILLLKIPHTLSEKTWRNQLVQPEMWAA